MGRELPAALRTTGTPGLFEPAVPGEDPHDQVTPPCWARQSRTDAISSAQPHLARRNSHLLNRHLRRSVSWSARASLTRHLDFLHGIGHKQNVAVCGDLSCVGEGSVRDSNVWAELLLFSSERLAFQAQGVGPPGPNSLLDFGRSCERSSGNGGPFVFQDSIRA